MLFVILILPICLLAKNVYVDAFFGRDDFPGTKAFPYRTIQKVPYEFQRGGNEMMRIHN